MNEYEMMTIIHPRLNADETTAAIEAVERLIATNAGELLSTDVWGRRRLAYPINHVNDGTYVLMTFNMPPTGTAPMEREMRISESVLRHMLIRGIIPFEGGRDERDDRDDRRGDREDDRDSEREDEHDDFEAPSTSEEADAPEADDEPSAEAPAVEETVAEEAAESADTDDESQA